MEKETIKISLPTGLVNKLESLFTIDNNYTTKDFKKILFIIYLINKGNYNSKSKNYENYYELSTRNLKLYLSLNLKLNQIINILIDNNIIKKSGYGIKGINYQRFTLNTPIDNNKDIQEIYLHPEDGKYVTKYINDNYIVKYQLYDNIIKKNKVKELMDKETGEIIDISSILKHIKNLEERIITLENQKQAPVELIIDNVTDSPVLVNEAPVELPNDVKQEVNDIVTLEEKEILNLEDLEDLEDLDLIFNKNQKQAPVELIIDNVTDSPVLVNEAPVGAKKYLKQEVNDIDIDDDLEFNLNYDIEEKIEVKVEDKVEDDDEDKIYKIILIATKNKGIARTAARLYNQEDNSLMIAAIRKNGISQGVINNAILNKINSIYTN